MGVSPIVYTVVTFQILMPKGPNGILRFREFPYNPMIWGLDSMGIVWYSHFPRQKNMILGVAPSLKNP